ncbi:DUF1835 domain-containing protein [Lederbergia citrea]|uniref:DUF1835 domain-containing protein n=1 Tax=Lederbergia citrea TaxID=2833581 RepID=UPI003D295E12
MTFSDMFSIGPIWQLHERKGKQERFEWLKIRMNDEFDEYKLRFEKTINEIKSIPEGVPITIWIADNAHEQTGLRYVMHLLKGKNNDINLINTTKVYGKLFNAKKYTILLHLHSGEIPPEKLHLIYENGWRPPLTQREREELEKEWLELANSRDTLRIWRNDRIAIVSEDYYDQYMINTAKKLYRHCNPDEFIMSARLIGEVLGHLDQYVGDQFLEYRLRQLIEKGVFDMEGSLKAMRFYRIRLKI